MKERKITENVWWLGAIDWDRRLFDALIPLPDGTTYNAYLVRGDRKTALLDSVDPAMTTLLMERLDRFPSIDYVVANHAEQDHSGSIPHVLARFPNAKVICTPKCKDMLADHLHISPEKLVAVADGEILELGGKTLQFLHTPWVHWPETMCTWLKEDGILFSCDFFGSHLATSDLYASDEGMVYESAKRYFAEIMMPFRTPIKSNLEKVGKFPIKIIAPSHGPVHKRPQFILDAYKDWVLSEPKNLAVVAYVSMHGSTAAMVERLVTALGENGVPVRRFNLPYSDIGKLAMSLVDAATIVIGTPTVLAGPHPA
ncbi:MAG: FprA family A-type flavoprotein, partial [bacterium]